MNNFDEVLRKWNSGRVSSSIFSDLPNWAISQRILITFCTCVYIRIIWIILMKFLQNTLVELPDQFSVTWQICSFLHRSWWKSVYKFIMGLYEYTFLKFLQDDDQVGLPDQLSVTWQIFYTDLDENRYINL